MKWKNALSCFAAVVATSFAGSLPGYAGSWVLTASASSTASSGSTATPGFLVLDNTSTEYQFMASYMVSPSGSMSATFNGSIQWVGGGTQPSSVTLTETSTASSGAAYSENGTFWDVSDGLGDPMVVTRTPGDPYPSSDGASRGTHTTTIPMSPGEVYTFTRTLSAAGSGGAYVTNSCEYTASVS